MIHYMSIRDMKDYSSVGLFYAAQKKKKCTTAARRGARSSVWANRPWYHGMGSWNGPCDVEKRF